MLNKNTLGVKKVRGQSEAALQIGMCAYDRVPIALCSSICYTLHHS